MRFVFIKTAASVTAALLLAQSALAACNANIPLTRPDTRYEAVAGTNGAEVRDKVTQLIWQRCVLGKTWDGTTCTGTAATYTWQNALDAARTATVSPVVGAPAWRVPNHAELYSLAERACVNPAINATWFPADPAGWAWSSSPSAGYSDYAWFVSFDYGNDGYGYKSNAYFVRLVRSGQ